MFIYLLLIRAMIFVALLVMGFNLSFPEMQKNKTEYPY